jgi:multisubunit Na+/H+ antiporter MnhB subunit
MMLQVFDGILILVISVLAFRALNDRDLFRAVIQFIALGLLLAVAWVRLRAPDVALAEAAVGSGLTGALILSALVRMRLREKSANAGRRARGGSAMMKRIGIGFLSLPLLAGLGWAVLALPVKSPGLTQESLARLPGSGVTNPVTAVLLNYRAYDTLLEIGVLLLAIVGAWSLVRGELPGGDLRARPLLPSLLRVLLPVLLLAAGYLLWIGAFVPGGAFQGGALLGGALVLVMLGGLGGRVVRHERWLRIGLVLGVLVFAALGALSKLLTGGLLQYPPGGSGTWILIIESAALISIGLTLGLLYFGGRPAAAGKEITDGRPGVHA